MPVVKVPGAANVGTPAPGNVVLTSTERLPRPRPRRRGLVCRRRSRPAMATLWGLAPAWKSCLEANDKVVAPGAVVLSSTETVLADAFATARSRRPSPLRSATATETGLFPVGKSCLAAKLGVSAPGAVWFRSTDTLFDPELATTRSGMPSPFRSLMATAEGLVPVGKSTWPLKEAVLAPGLIVFKRTDAVAEPPLVTTRSGMRSPLRSATATDVGFDPVAKSAWLANENVVAPVGVVFRRTDTALRQCRRPQPGPACHRGG